MSELILDAIMAAIAGALVGAGTHSTPIAFGLRFIRDFFDFSMPAWQNTLPLLAVILAVAILQWLVAGDAGKKLKARSAVKTKL